MIVKIAMISKTTEKGNKMQQATSPRNLNFYNIEKLPSKIDIISKTTEKGEKMQQATNKKQLLKTPHKSPKMAKL